MKRLLLPLLTALALPPSVNSQYLNLECTINFRNFKETHKLSINLNGNYTKITQKKALLYAESKVKEDKILIFYREDSPDGGNSSYLINRINGNLLISNQINQYTAGDPYFDEDLIEKVKNLKPSKELPKASINALLTPQTSSGKCKRLEKAKTLF